MSHPADAKLESFHVSEVVSNGRGGKSASLSVQNRPIKLILRQCTTPFEVSSFDRVSDRKSLDVRANDEIIAFCQRLDTELLKHASKLGCNAGGYTRLRKEQKDNFPPLFRHKLSISESGKSGCKFFEAGTKRRLSDEEVSQMPWRDLEMNILCKISSVWINAGRWGASATPEAILVKRCDTCPFEDGDLDSLE